MACSRGPRRSRRTFSSSVTGQQLALAQAIRDGTLAAVKELVPKTDLAALGNKKTTLLFFAVQEVVPVKNDAANVRHQIISELVRDGEKPEQPFGAADEDIANVAARADNPNLLKALLDGGMSLDLRYDGDTPLLFDAAEDSLLPQVRILIEHHAVRRTWMTSSIDEIILLQFTTGDA